MKKIGWQKYETFLEDQVSSTFLAELIKKSFSQMIEEDEDVEEYSQYEEDPQESSEKKILQMIPISDKLVEEAIITANFDCWVGHTNFDITHEIKNTLDAIDGIEVLKVMSRYRFFIGIGKMFEFKNVRKSIEKKITKE